MNAWQRWRCGRKMSDKGGAILFLLRKNKWAILQVTAVIVLLVAMMGCSRGEVELKNTVTAYTKMLSEALAKPDPKVMEYFTTSLERQRIEAYIMFLLKDKRVLISTVRQLEFTGITRDSKAKAATMMTSETWSYHYVDEKSRQPITQEDVISYHNVYHLIEEDGHWVVEKVDVTETNNNTQKQ